MARAAFIMDKIMHKMGPRQSLYPSDYGIRLQCTLIMASRTIENPEEVDW